MTTQMTLDGDEIIVGRAVRIRQLFGDIGGSMPTYDFAHVCIEHGLYSPEELERAKIQKVQSDIRRALKAPDDVGLPFAGQTAEKSESGGPVWRQRRYWSFDDYEINITELIDNRDENHESATRLRGECMSRFGRAPEIPPVGIRPRLVA